MLNLSICKMKKCPHLKTKKVPWGSLGLAKIRFCELGNDEPKYMEECPMEGTCMKVYAGGVGKLAYVDYMIKNQIGMCIPANQWRYPKTRMSWFLDNGAYSAFTHGTEFDSKKFLESLDKIESCSKAPDFIVCPDIVAGGLRSLHFSLSWVDKIPAGYSIYILDSWKGKDVYLPDSLAREKGVNPGTHGVGIVWETDKAIKVRIRSEEFWLPKDTVKVVTVEKRGLFDFGEVG